MGCIPTPDPVPGSLFREYLWVNKFNSPADYLVLSGGEGQYMDKKGPTYPRPAIDLPCSLDLEHAIRAEAVIEFATIHVGGEQAMRVNDSAWIPIPFFCTHPAPQDNICYSLSAIDVPLQHLRSGQGNTFAFTVDGTNRYHCIYGVTVRVHYDAARKPGPRGHMVTPRRDEALGECVDVTAEGSSPNGPIAAVDYLVFCDDVDYRCTGGSRNWQYYLFHGQYSRHIGTAPRHGTMPPWCVRWHTSWIPEQGQEMLLCARLVDFTDMVYVTEAVPGLTFNRPGLTVEMSRAEGVGGTQHIVGYRRWKTVVQNFTVKGDLAKAVAAQYTMTDWNGYNNGGFSINGVKMQDVAVWEILSSLVHCNPVKPLSALRSGPNVFTADIPGPVEDWTGIFIHWPGVAVKIQYRD